MFALITGTTNGIGKSIAKSFYGLRGNVIGTSTTKNFKKRNFLLYKVDFLKKNEFDNFCNFCSLSKDFRRDSSTASRQITLRIF